MNTTPSESDKIIATEKKKQWKEIGSIFPNYSHLFEL